MSSSCMDANVLPVNNAYGAVVLGMDTSNVDTVFIAGTLRKRQGQLVNVDMGRVRRLAQQSRDYVVSKARLATDRCEETDVGSCSRSLLPMEVDWAACDNDAQTRLIRIRAAPR